MPTTSEHNQTYEWRARNEEVWWVQHLHSIWPNCTNRTNQVFINTHKAMAESQLGSLWAWQTKLLSHRMLILRLDRGLQTRRHPFFNCQWEKISLLRKIWCCTNLPHGQWSAIHQHIKDHGKFSVDYGFKHTTSSKYHPKGNGTAEAAVKVAESILKIADNFHTAMYRNTPPQGHTYSPAQGMFFRWTRTTLPTDNRLLLPTMLNFEVVDKEILKKQQSLLQQVGVHWATATQ